MKEIDLLEGLALCPDFNNENFKGIGWKNHLNAETFQFIETTVRKCTKNCASSSQIQNFINKLVIENYVIQPHIDFTKFGVKPLYYSNDLLKRSIFTDLKPG